VLSLLILLNYGCREFTPQDQNDRLLASAFGDQLYLSDVASQLNATHSKQDSEIIVSRIVDTWIMDKIIYSESKKLGNSSSNINRLVEDYKKSLLIHNYESQYVETHLDTVVTESEMESFFNTNFDQFKVSEDIIRFIMVKVGNEYNNDSLSNFWKTEDLPALASIINQANGLYLLDFDKWYYKSELKSLLSEDLIKKITFKKPDSYSFSNQEFKFFVKIIEIIKIDEKPPFGFFKQSIRQRILRDRSRILLTQMKNNLYKDKIKSKSIQTYLKTN